MPDSNHPPYDIVIPRQMHRWLDKNAQNGPLKKCQTYFTIPIALFHQAYTSSFQTYSRLVGRFACTSTNKFSIIGYSTLADYTNCVLCVSFTNEDGEFVRYALNEDSSAVFYFDLPLYTNQKIPLNFYIEAWDTANSWTIGEPAITTPITFYTSVRTKIDYRYGTDTALFTPGAKDMNLAHLLDGISMEFPLPFEFNQPL